MSKKHIHVVVTILISVFLLGQAQAKENSLPQGDIQVYVKGMVCSFCARGLEKKLKEQKQIIAVHIEMKKRLVSFALKPKTFLTDNNIKKIIEDSGFSLEKIVRLSKTSSKPRVKAQEKQIDALPVE